VLGPGWAATHQRGEIEIDDVRLRTVFGSDDQDDFHCADFEPLGCKRRRLEPAQWSAVAVHSVIIMLDHMASGYPAKIDEYLL